MAESDLEIRRRTDFLEIERLRKSTANTPKNRVLIVTTPRSASTFFCGSIKNDLKLENLPTEFFSLKFVKEVMQKESITADQYLDEIIKGNLNFTAKIHLHQYQYWKMVNVDIPSRFNKFIYLYRDDELAQLKSRIIAKKTSYWNSWYSGGWNSSEARKENGISEYTPTTADIEYELKELNHEKTALRDFIFDGSISFDEVIDNQEYLRKIDEFRPLFC